MKRSVAEFRSQVIVFGYCHVAKPIFFRFDPEKIHDRMIKFGSFLGNNCFGQSVVRSIFKYDDARLGQTIGGIYFSNPVGLAAGFDKNGHLLKIMDQVGFGYMEVGSVTAKSYSGNPGPHLVRLPKKDSILVNYGLMSDGSEAVLNRLNQVKAGLPVGISVAMTNCAANADTKCGIDDFLFTLNLFRDVADYFTLNVSCPNSFGGLSFGKAKQLHLLLTEVDKLSLNQTIFVKLSPDYDNQEADQIIAVLEKHQISGCIVSNLTKQDQEIKRIGSGGLSGKMVADKSNRLISHLYKQMDRRFIIIGCGGIFTAEDAWQKIGLGASLLQLATGMIFNGPAIIGQINAGLVKYLEKEGYTNLSQAVGWDSANTRA